MVETPCSQQLRLGGLFPENCPYRHHRWYWGLTVHPRIGAAASAIIVNLDLRFGWHDSFWVRTPWLALGFMPSRIFSLILHSL